MARNVLFLHSSAGRYGADLQLLALAGGLDPARYRALAVLPERGELARPLEEAGVEVQIHPLAVARRVLASPSGMAGTARRLFGDRRTLPELTRERGVGIVHSNTSVLLAGPALARRIGARHVVHLREIYAGSAATRAVWPTMRRGLRRADAVLCISHAVAAQLGRAPNAAVVYDGLARLPERRPREASRAELGVSADAFAVALIGRVSDWKGQDVLVRALAEPPLRDIGAIGLVAGDAYPGNERYEEDLRRLAGELEVEGRLRMLGFREDVETVLGAADVVAVPSTRPEPLGLVALEAAAAGLPVVGAAHGGLPEIVRDGETGLLVAPDDQRALATALRVLSDDPDLARRMGEAAAADVLPRFTRERMLAEVQATYDRLLDA